MVQRLETSTVGNRRRDVDEILSRKRPNGQVLPPDFIHGEVPVATLYEHFEASWIERALFVVLDGPTVTVGRFDDYFLHIQQWDGDEAIGWATAIKEVRDRRIGLVVDGTPVLEDLTTTLNMSREQLWGLERRLLGVRRDGVLRCRGREDRLQRGRTDLLSLICLVGEP